VDVTFRIYVPAEGAANAGPTATTVPETARRALMHAAGLAIFLDMFLLLYVRCAAEEVPKPVCGNNYLTISQLCQGR
jgi:hypothetical protein